MPDSWPIGQRRKRQQPASNHHNLDAESAIIEKSKVKIRRELALEVWEAVHDCLDDFDVKHTDLTEEQRDEIRQAIADKLKRVC